MSRVPPAFKCDRCGSERSISDTTDQDGPAQAYLDRISLNYSTFSLPITEWGKIPEARRYLLAEICLDDPGAISDIIAGKAVTVQIKGYPTPAPLYLRNVTK